MSVWIPFITTEGLFPCLLSHLTVPQSFPCPLNDTSFKPEYNQYNKQLCLTNINPRNTVIRIKAAVPGTAVPGTAVPETTAQETAALENRKHVLRSVSSAEIPQEINRRGKPHRSHLEMNSPEKTASMQNFRNSSSGARNATSRSLQKPARVTLPL